MNGPPGPVPTHHLSFIGEIFRSASRKRNPETLIAATRGALRLADPSHPASFDFTRDDTFPMSARPASLPFSAPMTLPMSAAPLAPVVAIAAEPSCAIP